MLIEVLASIKVAIHKHQQLQKCISKPPNVKSALWHDSDHACRLLARKKCIQKIIIFSNTRADEKPGIFYVASSTKVQE